MNDWTAMTAEEAEDLASYCYRLYRVERKLKREQAEREAEAKCSTTTTQKE